MRYKVLWIDDEYKKQHDFIGEAEQEGIDINPFESHEEGMNELNNKLDFYHAVILDAKVKKGKDDTVTGLSGLTASRDRLIEINKNNYLPFFIFTGQPDYTDAGWFNETYGKYYIKAIDNEVLFKDLISAVDKTEKYQIQKKYEIVFDACTEKYIGKAAAHHLMDILLSIEYSTGEFNDEKYFNGLRKVIEFVFRACNKIGLLHDKCLPNGIVNLTWSCLFLSGREVELKPSNAKVWTSKCHFPVLLANNVKSILDTTNAASHTEDIERENGKVNFSEYKSQVNSNYLLYSLTFQVMDLVLWFKKYAEENPVREKNKAFWVPPEIITSEWQDGSVINYNSTKGFAFFKPDVGYGNIIIPPALVSENRLNDDDKVSVLIEEYEDNKNRETKTRVKHLKKIG